MKTVLIMRHGKSDWDASFSSDAERPLAKRGRRSASLMGRFITESGVAPDLALTSPAVRAKTTLELAATSGGWEGSRRVEPGLYDGSAVSVTEIIRTTPNEVRILLLAGHQPTWAALASRLVGGAALSFPTAAVACIDFNISTWNEVGPGQGELRWLVPPRVVPEP